MRHAGQRDVRGRGPLGRGAVAHAGELVGPCALRWAYFVCLAGHGGWTPADAAWALGTPTLLPALMVWVPSTRCPP